MKVKDLKKILEDKDDDFIVFYYEHEYGEWYEMRNNDIKIDRDEDSANGWIT